MVTPMDNSAPVGDRPPSKILIFSLTALSWVAFLVVIVLYGIASGQAAGGALKLVAACAIVALGAFIVGGFLGFLCGIPLALSKEEASSDYRANNTLQQVLDWLLKILLGAGLTQLTHIP